MTTHLIAEICHNVNKAYCESIGDHSQPSWEEAPDWQKESAINGVEFHLDNDVTPEQSHMNWYVEKDKAGWVYGEVKDPEKKTHPCMVSYSKLPIEQRTKDFLFKAVCDTFKARDEKRPAWGLFMEGVLMKSYNPDEAGYTQAMEDATTSYQETGVPHTAERTMVNVRELQNK